MKKLLLVVLVMVGLASCKNDSGSPTAAIDGMFNAMKSGDLEGMKKFITKSDVSLLEAGEKILNSVDPEAIKKMKTEMAEQFKEKVKAVTYTLKNEKINGDNATVEAEVTENGKTSSHNFELVKEDGAWKIALSKSGDGMFNSMKGDMGPGGNKDLEEGIEKLKNMHPDSLKELIKKGMEALDSIKSKSKTN